MVSIEGHSTGFTTSSISQSEVGIWSRGIILQRVRHRATSLLNSSKLYVRSLNFHKKPQRDFVFHFFLKFYYSLFILFFLLFIFFSARRCARNCVLAYRELRDWNFLMKYSRSKWIIKYSLHSKICKSSYDHK